MSQFSPLSPTKGTELRWNMRMVCDDILSQQIKGVTTIMNKKRRLENIFSRAQYYSFKGLRLEAVDLRFY